MGLFLYFNLLIEMELRLACWEIATGIKGSNEFLCISKRINKDQRICWKQREPHDPCAFYLLWAARLTMA